MFPFMPITTCPVAGHFWKEPGYILFKPPLHVFKDINEIHQASSPDWEFPALSVFPQGEMI